MLNTFLEQCPEYNKTKKIMTVDFCVLLESKQTLPIELKAGIFFSPSEVHKLVNITTTQKSETLIGA